jgi:hypothetical protein
VLNATSELRGNLIEEAVESLFQEHGILYIRTGANNQAEIEARFERLRVFSVSNLEEMLTVAPFPSLTSLLAAVLVYTGSFAIGLGRTPGCCTLQAAA